MLLTNKLQILLNYKEKIFVKLKLDWLYRKMVVKVVILYDNMKSNKIS